MSAKRSGCSPNPTDTFEVLEFVAGISKALGFAAAAFKALKFVTGILKPQPPRLQHLPAKPPDVERLLKKGHKVLSLPKAMGGPIPALLFLHPPSLQERRGAAEGVKALRL